MIITILSLRSGTNNGHLESFSALLNEYNYSIKASILGP